MASQQMQKGYDVLRSKYDGRNAMKMAVNRNVIRRLPSNGKMNEEAANKNINVVFFITVVTSVLYNDQHSTIL